MNSLIFEIESQLFHIRLSIMFIYIRNRIGIVYIISELAYFCYCPEFEYEWETRTCCNLRFIYLMEFDTPNTVVSCCLTSHGAEIGRRTVLR